MTKFLIVLGIVLGWWVLMRYVLPWLGIPTCCSGPCGWQPREGEREPEESA